MGATEDFVWPKWYEKATGAKAPDRNYSRSQSYYAGLGTYEGYLTGLRGVLAHAILSLRMLDETLKGGKPEGTLWSNYLTFRKADLEASIRSAHGAISWARSAADKGTDEQVRAMVNVLLPSLGEWLGLLPNVVSFMFNLAEAVGFKLGVLSAQDSDLYEELKELYEKFLKEIPEPSWEAEMLALLALAAAVGVGAHVLTKKGKK